MKYRKFIPSITIVLIFALAATALAAYLLQARMTLFSGHIEQPSGTKAKLVLKMDDENLGDTANIAGGSVVFPALTGVVGSTTTDGPTEWADENGEKPLSAPKFTICAEKGDVEDVRLKIVANGSDMGNSGSEALVFGITIVYYDNTAGRRVTKTEFLNFCAGTPDMAETEAMPLGDAFLVDGEEAEIYISVWADAEVLEKLGTTGTADFNIEAIFSASAAET